MSSEQAVGSRSRRFDAMDKACGRERLASDDHPEGMLWAGALRAGVPHGLIRCPGAEDLLVGRAPALEAFREAGAVVRRMVRPIDDVRASADYWRQVAGNQLLRLAEQAGPMAVR